MPSTARRRTTVGERVLRGSRLGAVSYETAGGTSLGRASAAGGEVPAVGERKVCGGEALLVDGERPEPKKVKPARTHWDMLMERRTTEDLEEVLAERLARGRGRAPHTPPHPAPQHAHAAA